MSIQKLPEFFRPVLWSYQFSKLHPLEDARAIIVQTINYGQWRHWQWVAKMYGKNKIREVIKKVPATEFRSSALKLARILFGVSKMKYASRIAYIKQQKTLAKT